DAVRAVFVAELPINAFAFEAERDLAEAAAIGRAGLQDLAPPPFFLGVVLVHLKQVLGKESGFLAAGPSANFHHAPPPIGILAADGRVEELAPQLLSLLADFRQLRSSQLLLVGRACLRHSLELRRFIDECLEAAILR